ncbi:MAG: ATP-binding protein [Bacteroidota bacterium]
MEIRSVKWLTLGLFLALSAALGAVAVERMERIAQTSDELRDQPFVLADALLRAHFHIHKLHTALRDQIFAGNQAPVQAMAQRDTDDDRALTEALDLVVTRHIGDERTLPELVRALSAWRDTRERAADLFLAGRWQDASFVLGTEGERRYNELHQALDVALHEERRHAEQLRSETEAARHDANSLVLVLAVLAAGALAATGVGLTTMLKTSRPLRRLSGRLLALADGDVHTPIPYMGSSSAIGSLASAIATLRQGMIERDTAFRALAQSQDQLRDAMEDVWQANAAKSRFLAAASHDLRQPMQALRLYLDTLDRRVSDRLDRRILTGALAALGAGEELLRNFLDVSVLESGIVQPTVADVPVAHLLTELGDASLSLAEDKGLELRLVPCGATIRSDATLLKRLLVNLVGNAIRYTTTGRVVVGCRRRGRFLRIEVWDTGIGIAADQLQAVFEDFYQIGNPERDRTKGLGLGLSVVQRTAQLLNHRISVVSHPGRGSMFAVTVPLAPEPEPSRANGARAAA